MRRADDTGRSVMAMLVVLVGVMMSLLLVPLALLDSRRPDPGPAQHGAYAETDLDVEPAARSARPATTPSRQTPAWLPCGPQDRRGPRRRDRPLPNDDR